MLQRMVIERSNHREKVTAMFFHHDTELREGIAVETSSLVRGDERLLSKADGVVVSGSECKTVEDA